VESVGDCTGGRGVRDGRVNGLLCGVPAGGDDDRYVAALAAGVNTLMVWRFDSPIPTPTPIPLSQVGAQVGALVDKSEQFYSTVLQYGVLGVFGLFIFFLILLTVLGIVYFYTRRNQTQRSQAETQSTLTIGSIALSLQEQLKIAQQQLALANQHAEEQAAHWIQQQAEQDERNIESLSAVTAMLDSIRQLARGIKDMFDSSIQKDTERDQRFAQLNANIAQIVDEGSEPVQKTQKIAEEIRDKLSELGEIIKRIHDRDVDYRALKEALQPSFTEVMVTIRERQRKTEPIPVIPDSKDGA